MTSLGGACSLSTGSRIRSVKMNIEIIIIPDHFLQKILRNSLENGIAYCTINAELNRSRVKFFYPLAAGEEGSTALPSLRNYYLSSQLRPILYSCNQSYVAKWKTIELCLIDAPIQSLLGCVGKAGKVKEILQMAIYG